jgi:hypothetical protein
MQVRAILPRDGDSTGVGSSGLARLQLNRVKRAWDPGLRQRPSAYRGGCSDFRLAEEPLQETARNAANHIRLVP